MTTPAHPPSCPQRYEPNAPCTCGVEHFNPLTTERVWTYTFALSFFLSGVTVGVLIGYFLSFGA